MNVETKAFKRRGTKTDHTHELVHRFVQPALIRYGKATGHGDETAVYFRDGEPERWYVRTRVEFDQLYQAVE